KTLLTFVTRTRREPIASSTSSASRGIRRRPARAAEDEEPAPRRSDGWRSRVARGVFDAFGLVRSRLGISARIIHERLRSPLRSFPPNASSALLCDASDIAVVALPRLDEKSLSRTTRPSLDPSDAFTTLQTQPPRRVSTGCP